MLFVYTHKDEQAIELFKKAITTLNHAKKIKPSKKVINALNQTQSKLAQVYNRLQQHAFALELLQEIVHNIIHHVNDLNHINNNATIYSELGLTYLKMAQNSKSIEAFQEALTHYNLALKVNPNNIMVLGNMANIYSFLLKIEIKTVYLKQSIAINSKIIHLYENDFLNISFEDDALNITQNMMIPLLGLINAYSLLEQEVDKNLLISIEKVKAKKLKQLMLNNLMEKTPLLANRHLAKLKIC